MLKYFTFFIFLYLGLIQAIKINLAANSVHIYDNLYSTLRDEFNKYSKENNLGIELEMNLFSDQNVTADNVKEYGTTIDSYLLKNSNKYDIYCYDPLYTIKYAPHLLNLKMELPKSHMDLYSSGDAKKVGAYNNKWVGIPLFHKYTMLYSNKKLLLKYNKKVPKTWDELLDTAKYILNRERQANNIDIVGYNGLFTSLNYVTSIFDFIYSFRNSTNTVFPGFDSPEAIDALNMLKKIKEEISSDEIFKADEFFNIQTLINDKGLFMRFWDQPDLNNLYYITPLPGKKKGINSGLINSINLGISQNISNKNKNAALEVLKFLTSERVQKEIVVKEFRSYTGIKKLYDDKEVCDILNCPLVKKAQTVHREFKDIDNTNVDQYCSEIVSIFDSFLFKSKSAEEALSEIVDISKIYFVSLNNIFGLISFFLLILTACFLILVFVLLPQKKYKIKYSFFTLDLWIMYCLGYMVILFSEFLNYGKLSGEKCQMRYSLLFIGINLTTTPILYKLLVSFPTKRNFSQSLVTNKDIFIIIFVGIEVLLNIVLLITPFSTEEIYFNNTVVNKNFERCTMTSTFGNVIILIDIIIKMIEVLCILILSYIEWNVKEIYEDVRAIVINEYINNFSFILLIIFNYIDINNYEYIFFIHSIFIIIICMTNYINILSINLLLISKEKNTNVINIRPYNSSFSNKGSSVSSSGMPEKNNFLNKIVNYHYGGYNITNPSSFNNRSLSRNNYSSIIELY